MPKIKTGEVISWKEFGKRWKKGIEGITQLQQVKMQIRSTWIIIVGILCGIYICIIGLKNLWWLLIILMGGLFNTFIQLIGLEQRKIMLLNFEYLSKEEVDK